ncbi:MAG: cyclic nucleotide-binding domain-containing protein [Coleofasciculaceae cyanobacterium]
MFGKVSERQMHLVRWLLTSGWLLLIFSLFYDPISPRLTDPKTTWSPLRIDPNLCVKVQGVCLEEKPYPIGAALFWGLIVPSAIFILLVFGHELWRRICPLSFLSQMPNALKWQRQNKREDKKTGKIRYEIVKVKKDSWLGRNYLYLQFGWLFVGLCSRILFINSDRLFLGLWLLFTIIAAIAVGYLYGGKSWCQYFCAMAPVQKIYAEPGGLLSSKAHTDEQSVTQSMCRTTNEEGKEQSACVACKSPCIDIDSERSYWDGITEQNQKILYYGYFGLVVGYFAYYYLYAGNWDYYFSGAWAHQENQLESLMNPGFYISGNLIAIPKLVAVPLTLGLFSWGGYLLGQVLEKQYKATLRRHHKSLTNEEIQHRIFTLCTYIVFNIFFVFGGRPFILLLPTWVQGFCDLLLVGLSTLWLTRTWKRSPELYSRESLASRFRKQLAKLKLDVSQFIEGRSLDDLNTHEVYVLAKVLPGFTKEKRHEAYKGVLRDALEEGYVDTASSLEVLQQMRSELNISNEEHREVLEELGVEDPELLNPSKKRSRENLVRLTGYRKALERIVSLRQRQSGRDFTGDVGNQTSIGDLLQDDSNAIKALRREYSITSQEEIEILEGFDKDAGIIRRADFLLSQMSNLTNRYRAFNQPILLKESNVLTLLRSNVQQKRRLVIRGLLEIIESLGQDAEATRIASSLNSLSTIVLQELLEDRTSQWHSRLPAEIIAFLSQPGESAPTCSLELKPDIIIGHLEAMLQEPNQVIQAMSLYILYQLDDKRGRTQARQLLASNLEGKKLVQEMAETFLNQKEQANVSVAAFSAIEKLVYLSNSDFFSGVKTETLMELADRAQIKAYKASEVVTEEGDTCRELLLLIEGEAQIETHDTNGNISLRNLLPGQILDELEVLSHSAQAGTIITKVAKTRILAIPVDTFDDLLDRDHEFARRVLEMESRRLQQLVQLS